MAEQETTVIDSWLVVELDELFLSEYSGTTKNSEFKFRTHVMGAKQFHDKKLAAKIAKSCHGQVIPVMVSVGIPEKV
ncbi:hypothetical protein [Furfurilactobacillus rossiae]|uniref:Uncharacterized protein n=1 Tax=Furfurilactobacillus rossiae DSM 15814 TaxID=1114972 RepID=A0A0R1RJF4_9LACO|nr:hypothetical protein [Furfurilactobacillus rossiae]KRL56657.1 hypothetical protein FD35_GL001756 [Furfurilactobacillus rossiae DSM 15814]QFR66442.1 hypothetical protein LR814_04745 [Furfurilactobacillus rossiae]QLE61899.1 hypothetical protein LROSRS0_1854 [Furfurilactobacillus rossiae]